MTARPASRIVVVSSDDVLGQRIAKALLGLAPAVDVRSKLDDGGAQPVLVVVDLDGDPEVLASVQCPVIVVTPRASVASVVELMQTSPHVAGSLVMEEFDATTLRQMASRLIADDVFGLDKVMAPGTHVTSYAVGTYEQLGACSAQIASHVQSMGLRRAYEPIEQCIDEMIMNALYDAPVGADGKHVFEGVSIRQRIRMRTAQDVVVQYAADDRKFAVSVRDAFGSLQRSTVIRHLYKAVHARDKVDRKAGGAGLGVYLMATSATAVYFNVLPGIGTEAICCFDRDPSTQPLEQFGFFTQHDARGQAPTPPARRRYVKPRYALWGTVAASAIALVAAVIVVPKLLETPEQAQVSVTTNPAGATVDIDGHPRGIASGGTLAVTGLEAGRSYRIAGHHEGYEPHAVTLTPHGGANALALELRALPRVELDSQPHGATVEIDGKVMGTTPLALTSLAAGTTVSIAYKYPGFVTATTKLEVPAIGKTAKHAQPLDRSPDFVRVRLASTPAGAAILEPGQPLTPDRTYAPADVFLEVGKPRRFMLAMPSRVPAVIELVPSRDDDGKEKLAMLTSGATLRIDAARGGKVTVVGTPHCIDLTPPATCTLAPGTYVVEYAAGTGPKVTQNIEISSIDAKAHFD